VVLNWLGLPEIIPMQARLVRLGEAHARKRLVVSRHALSFTEDMRAHGEAVQEDKLVDRMTVGYLRIGFRERIQHCVFQLIQVGEPKDCFGRRFAVFFRRAILAAS
jgi:hypothetical protein